jgi:hypothetical protein
VADAPHGDPRLAYLTGAPDATVAGPVARDCRPGVVRGGRWRLWTAWLVRAMLFWAIAEEVPRSHDQCAVERH